MDKTLGQDMFIRLVAEYVRQHDPNPVDRAREVVRVSMQRGILPWEMEYK